MKYTINEKDIIKLRNEFAAKEKFYKWAVIVIGIIAILNALI